MARATLERTYRGDPRYEVTENGCWTWLGAKNRKGYGHMQWNGEAGGAHRIFYKALRGPIPEGQQIHHVCRNKACVNPDHLQVVTPRQNTMLDDTPARRNAEKTHCKHGHEFTPENTIIRADGRECRACRYRSNAEHNRRKRGWDSKHLEPASCFTQQGEPG